MNNNTSDLLLEPKVENMMNFLFRNWLTCVKLLVCTFFMSFMARMILSLNVEEVERNISNIKVVLFLLAFLLIFSLIFAICFYFFVKQYDKLIVQNKKFTKWYSIFFIVYFFKAMNIFNLLNLNIVSDIKNIAGLLGL
ncbi:TPA: hypothetical protein ACG3HB_000619 [Clostridioides difficile]